MKTELFSKPFEFRYKENDDDKVFKYRYIKDKDTKMVRIEPLPSLKTLNNFYNKDYGSYISKKTLGHEAFSFKYKLAQWRYSNSYKQNILNYPKIFIASAIEILTGKLITPTLGIPLSLPKSSRILEIGFGSGEYLYSLKLNKYTDLHGFDIEANEENLKSLTNHGIQIATGNFLEYPVDENSIDLIRLEHVFEHLNNPTETLDKIYRLLKPGGILVMNMPSAYSYTFRIPEYSALLESPKHLFFHTKQSLIKYLEAQKFSKIVCRYHPVSLHFCIVYREYWAKKGFKIPLFVFKSASVLISPFYSLISNLSGKGEYINVVAIK